jgi:sugar phosphate isomerase/epimerase
MSFSLAYLTARHCTAAQAIRVAAETGYTDVGLRLWPNFPGAPCQPMLEAGAINASLLRETLAAKRDTGVGVFDLEIIRIAEGFDPSVYVPLFELGAQLQARAVLVAGDDREPQRLSHSYARLCEAMQPYGLTADLEFMPWTAVPHAQAALHIVREAGEPENAGILVDALHVFRSSTTLEDIRAIAPRLLHYAQINDQVSGLNFSDEQMIHDARCERLLPGEGDFDLAGLFAALPVGLPISVEVVHFARDAACSAKDWAAQCLAASRKYFDHSPISEKEAKPG